MIPQMTVVALLDVCQMEREISRAEGGGEGDKQELGMSQQKSETGWETFAVCLVW